jgi:chromosome partitioning protein
MHTIAFVTQKGGVGKSTLTSSTAVAARQAGERVSILDLDSLQSLVKWSRARESPDVPVEYVSPDKLGKALRDLRNKNFSLAIIDSPGADSECSEQAIRAADLCVIPARPNAIDLWASETTLARVKANRKEFAFLLNQCPPAQQSARVERGTQALQEMGALLAPLISTRVDYQEAVRHGLGATEFNPNGVAAHEMRKLWNSLKQRLEMDVAAAARAKQIDEARQLQSDYAKPTYEDLLAEAMKATTIYSNFVKVFFQFDEVKTSGPATTETPMKSGSTPKRGGC